MIAWIIACTVSAHVKDVHWDVTKALLKKASATGVPLAEGSLLVSGSDPWFALARLDKKVHGYGTLNPKAVYYYGLYDPKKRDIRLTRGEAPFKKDPKAQLFGKILIRVLQEDRMRNWLKRGFDYSVMRNRKNYTAFIGNLDRTVDSIMVLDVSADLRQVEFIGH